MLVFVPAPQLKHLLLADVNIVLIGVSFPCELLLDGIIKQAATAC